MTQSRCNQCFGTGRNRRGGPCLACHGRGTLGGFGRWFQALFAVAVAAIVVWCVVAVATAHGQTLRHHHHHHGHGHAHHLIVRHHHSARLADSEGEEEDAAPQELAELEACAEEAEARGYEYYACTGATASFLEPPE